MVELDDEYDGEQDESIRIKTCLGMNVPEVKAIANKLIANEVEVDYQEHTWGIVAKFFDSDGNLCAFMDSRKFEQQVEGYPGD